MAGSFLIDIKIITSSDVIVKALVKIVVGHVTFDGPVEALKFDLFFHGTFLIIFDEEMKVKNIMNNGKLEKIMLIILSDSLFELLSNPLLNFW